MLAIDGVNNDTLNSTNFLHREPQVPDDVCCLARRDNLDVCGRGDRSNLLTLFVGDFGECRPPFLGLMELGPLETLQGPDVRFFRKLHVRGDFGRGILMCAAGSDYELE